MHLRPGRFDCNSNVAVRSREGQPTRMTGTGSAEVSPIALGLIVDNRLLRERLTAMLQSQPGFKVLVASADVNEALQEVREAKPDILGSLVPFIGSRSQFNPLIDCRRVLAV